MTSVQRVVPTGGLLPPVGPYSPAVIAGDLVCTAGQIPRDADGAMPADFKGQVRQTLANLDMVLRAAGSGLNHVVKVSTFLTDHDQLEPYNEVYAEVFGDHRPARTSVIAGMWGVALEIECLAVRAPHDDTASAVLPGVADDVRDALARVECSTLGHFIEDGFLDPQIRLMTRPARVLGTAVTVRVGGGDAFAVNRAIAGLKKGEVLVIDRGGDRRQACIGAVTATAAKAQGAAGIIVDGLVTDLDDLQSIDLPIWAAGTSCRTTKLVADEGSEWGVPVTVGGVTVTPGDLVIADRNGVLCAPADQVLPHLDRAIASDEAEPGLLARLNSGEAVESLLKLG